MRQIGLILLGIAWIPGAVSCGNAEAAPATMTEGARGLGSGRVVARSTGRIRRGLPARSRPVVHACQRPTHVSATVGGRYSGQIQRLYVPRDCGSYGSFYDYGAYGPTSYAGQPNIPAGYWVYHYPYWHVYRHRSTVQVTSAPGGAYCVAPASTSANANGKYRVLERRMHVPQDCGIYGSFRDYGRYGATSYAGHANLPAGYWVYRYPYWYLWRSLRP